MSARGLLLNKLLAEPDISSVIPADRWFSGRALDNQVSVRPFAVVRFAGLFPGNSRIKQTRVEIWVHDDEGSYKRIENVLRDVKAVLDAMVQVANADKSVWIIQADWESDSVDLFDDGYRTNTKSTTYTLTGTGF